MGEDRCVCCGEIIPEGNHVCPNCRENNSQQLYSGTAKKENVPIDSMPPLIRGLFLTKEQEEKLKEPFKDVVSVVRCKDCINCVKEPNGELYCDILAVGYEPLGSKKVNAEWFCADGKNK
jgi:hypothetical protein